MTPIDQLGPRVTRLFVDVFEHVRDLVIDPSQRTFWLGLVVATIIAVALWIRRGRSGMRVAQWWNPSARVDYGLILLKPLFVAVFVHWAVSTATVAMLVIRGSTKLGLSWGVSPPGLSAHPWAVGIVYTIVLFLAWDLSRFGLHWLMHRVDVLWQFHQVHHSARTLTPLTLYRVHPLESALYFLRGVIVTGVLTGVFTWAFGADAVQIELWGINAVGFVFSTVSGNLRHSHVWWSFGPRLERWLISPAQHQLHHSCESADNRANYGTWIALWDRLAGTWRAADTAPASFGLPTSGCNHRAESVLSALIDPAFAIIAPKKEDHDRTEQTVP